MYKWYDSLKEPKRFLVFFIPGALLIAGTSVPYPTINYISWALLLTALVTRAIHLHKGKRGARNEQR